MDPHDGDEDASVHIALSIGEVFIVAKIKDGSDMRMVRRVAENATIRALVALRAETGMEVSELEATLLSGIRAGPPYTFVLPRSSFGRGKSRCELVLRFSDDWSEVSIQRIGKPKEKVPVIARHKFEPLWMLVPMTKPRLEGTAAVFRDRRGSVIMSTDISGLLGTEAKHQPPASSN